MARYLPEPSFNHSTATKVGVLLVNLGTPQAATAGAVRRYLRQFLSDPRVVEIPRAIWWLILHGVILNVRPRASAKKYASIWSKDGSPLRVWTEKQTKLLRGYLGERSRQPIAVAFGMRYGEPSIAQALADLKQQHCDRILLLPLYPQYAASTTATACDNLFDALKRYRNMPALRVVRQFHDDPGYITALAQSVREHWHKNGRGNLLVLSFHGLPRFSLDQGDPYHCQCHATARILSDQLGLTAEQYVVTFQSRFGRAKWLEPYTAPTLTKLAKGGVQRVDVLCPGFVSDCLETLEEIAIEAKHTFLTAGGKEFHYISCLNDRADWMQALTDITLANLHGWLDPTWNADTAAARSAATRQRALALGAKQ